MVRPQNRNWVDTDTTINFFDAISSCIVRAIFALLSAVCRFHTLISQPGFTKEAGCIRAEKRAAAVGFCDTLN